MTLKNDVTTVFRNLLGLGCIAAGGFTLVALKEPLWAFCFGVFGAFLVDFSLTTQILAALKPYLPSFLGGSPPAQ